VAGLLFPAAAAAQAVLGVQARIDVDREDVTSVALDIRLETGERGAVPLTLFVPRGVTVEDLSAGWGEGAAAVAVPLEPSRAHVLTGTVPAPGAAPRAEVAAAPDTSAASASGLLRLRYTVRNAEAGREPFDLIVPVARVDRPLSGSPEGFFTATVALSGDARLWETFPVGRASGPDAMSLPVLPSFVRLRGGRGDAPRLTVPRVADVGVGLAIVLLTLVGWRRARRPT
jgi:hypothetical protein